MRENESAGPKEGEENMSDTTQTAPITHNRVTDFDASDDFTKKHTPFITSERTGDKVLLSVEVGHVVPHPNQLDHFIMYIELHAFDVPIARFDFCPGVSDPKVAVQCTLPEGTKVTAIEHCNLHGVWMYEQTV